MICTECGSEMVRSTEPISGTFRDEEFLVDGIPHHICVNCGEIAFGLKEADEYALKVKEAYRNAHGLLSPREIREIRNGFNLTQKEFEAVIGVGKTAVSRWETGALVQPKSEDNLMREMRNHSCVAKDLICRANLDEKWEMASNANVAVCIREEFTIEAPSSVIKIQYKE